MSFILFASCSQTPVLSELTNDRINVVLKSTYASSTDYDWYALHTNDTYEETTNLLTAFSDGGLSTDVANMKFFIDFAELRMATGTGKPTGTLPEDYWQYPAQDRYLFCSEYVGLFSRQLLTCESQSGIDQLASFWGSGINLSVEDIQAGIYQHLGLYFRKIVTYPAKLYDNDTFSSEYTATFDNRQIEGLDVEPYYQQSPGSDSTVPLMFPLELTNLNLDIPSDDEPYFLEVRVLLKNAMMRHLIKSGTSFLLTENGGTVSIQTSDGSSDLTKVTGTNTQFTTDLKVGDSISITADFDSDADTADTIETRNITAIGSDTSLTVEAAFSADKTATSTIYTRYAYVAFIGPSDIINNHNYSDLLQSTQLGGNVLLTARVYKPTEVGSIAITNSVSVSANSYYVAMPAGSSFAPGTTPVLPYAATAANKSGYSPVIENLPAGNYDLYVACDKARNSGSGVASDTTGTDGYPETAQSCSTSTAVTAGQQTSATVNCSC